MVGSPPVVLLASHIASSPTLSITGGFSYFTEPYVMFTSLYTGSSLNKS